MRVLLSTYDSRGGVEPLAGLAVQLLALGVEAQVCAPPDEEFAERLAGLGVSLVPFGESVRAMVTRETPPSETDLRRQMDELIAAQFDTVAAAAEECDALVATDLLPTAAGAVGDRETGHPLRLRELSTFAAAVALPPAANVFGLAFPGGPDRQPSAVGPGRPDRERTFR
jgi:hypothetical protein